MNDSFAQKSILAFGNNRWVSKDNACLQKSFVVFFKSIDTHTNDRLIDIKDRLNNRFDRQEQHHKHPTILPHNEFHILTSNLPHDLQS